MSSTHDVTTSSTRQFQRILLIRLRRIGDVVFTTPAIRAVRQRFPDAHLAYLVEPASAPILVRNPHLDELIVAPPARGLRAPGAETALIRRLRAQAFDLAIDFHGGPRASLLAWLCGAPMRIGYEVVGRAWMYTHRVPRPRSLRARHSVENQWDLLQPLGIGRPDRQRHPVEMTVDPLAAKTVADRLARAGVAPTDRLIVVHVSSSSPFRCWPAWSFVEAIASLAAAGRDRRVVVTSGPSEAETAARVIGEARRDLGAVGARRVLRCGEFSIAELRALLERSAVYIGGDSGPLHVAATTRTPIVGLYGPTLPIRSAPWRPTDCATESIEVGPLPCRPCDQRRCAPGDFRCLTWIEPARVAAAAERMLSRGSGLEAQHAGLPEPETLNGEPPSPDP